MLTIITIYKTEIVIHAYYMYMYDTLIILCNNYTVYGLSISFTSSATSGCDANEVKSSLIHPHGLRSFSGCQILLAWEPGECLVDPGVIKTWLAGKSPINMKVFAGMT